MNNQVYSARVHNCTRLMQEQGLDALLLTKPANMQYLTGDGRLCAYTMVTRDGNSFVFVIDEKANARLTPVVAGTRQRGRVEIRAGLRVQDRIVGTGAGFVKDGDLVRVSN